MDSSKIALIEFIAGIVLTLASAALIFSGTFSIYVQILIGVVGLVLIGASRAKLFS